MPLETLGQRWGWKARINACTLHLFSGLTTVCLTLRGATRSQGCIFGEQFITVDDHGRVFSQWGRGGKMFRGATAWPETNRRCRGSSATGCLEVGIKNIEGIQNEDILTDLLLNYL